MNSQKHATGYRNNTKKIMQYTTYIWICQVFLNKKKKPRTGNQINESVRGLFTQEQRGMLNPTVQPLPCVTFLTPDWYRGEFSVGFLVVLVGIEPTYLLLYLTIPLHPVWGSSLFASQASCSAILCLQHQLNNKRTSSIIYTYIA